ASFFRSSFFSNVGHGPPRGLPPFPTRRSSDLQHSRRIFVGDGDAARDRRSAWAHRNDEHQCLGTHSRDRRHAGHWSDAPFDRSVDRKSTRLNSSHVKISYAVFCLKKKKQQLTF